MKMLYFFPTPPKKHLCSKNNINKISTAPITVEKQKLNKEYIK
jgi:hypothetical protein